MKKEAIIIFSGGIDSSLCLYEAMHTYGVQNILALSFNYDQTHAQELVSAHKIATDWKVEHLTLKLDFLKQISESALTNKESSNVVLPGRNGLFIRIAAILGFKHNAFTIITGVNEADAPDFPDCRRPFMDALEKVLRMDFENESFRILTPISGLSKKAILERAHKLGILKYLLENTTTCYHGISQPGCEKCLACKIRNKALQEFILEHPEFTF